MNHTVIVILELHVRLIYFYDPNAKTFIQKFTKLLWSSLLSPEQKIQEMLTMTTHKTIGRENAPNKVICDCY